MKKMSEFVPENFYFFAVKFPIHLNRRVFFFNVRYKLNASHQRFDINSLNTHTSKNVKMSSWRIKPSHILLRTNDQFQHI